MLKRILLLMSAVAFSWSTCAEDRVLPNEKLLNAELLARGKKVYANQCAGCHGPQGDGKGPAAYGLNPKPRDLTSGIFKFGSTPHGFLPTDEDLLRIIRQGVLGTSMPPFPLMSERDGLAVIQYMKTFSPEWQDPTKHASPVSVPPLPEWYNNPKSREPFVKEGLTLFQATCAPCHGATGDGNGTAAATLVDVWQQPIKPIDLRQPYIRRGKNVSDLYKVLVTGVNGTPMPNFGPAMNDDQRWKIVAYIDHLRRVKQGKEEPLPVATPSRHS